MITGVFIATYHFNVFLTWKQGHFIHCTCWRTVLLALGGKWRKIKKRKKKNCLHQNAKEIFQMISWFKESALNQKRTDRDRGRNSQI